MKHRHKHGRGERGASKSRSKLIALCIVIVLLLLLAYQGGRWLEERNNKPEARGDYTERRYASENIIDVDGVSYAKRRGITSILVMGVDRDSGTEISATDFRNGGQADFLRLIVIDNASHKIDQMQIDRDTMTPITILGVLGNKSGVRTAQISLSHGFGDGAEYSCQLTEDAVSNFLLGTDIDFYISMNLDGISALNDVAGGVTVTLEDDFSMIDPEMTQGRQITLVGDQAEIYVRSRMSMEVGTNEARMVRQQNYISQLVSQLNEKIRADRSYINTMYDAIEPYIITDMNRGRLINEIWAARDYERTTLVELEGTHRVGSDGFMQFYADEASVQQAVLSLFYEKVE